MESTFNFGIKICLVETDLNFFDKEFDPGSGRTLAARLKHASRTKRHGMKSSDRMK